MKSKKFFFLVIFLITISFAEIKPQEQPKLVVGIIIDQMRYDYISRFQKFYGKEGFNRLINEGSNFTYTHFTAAQTPTAVGHATIYTGTVPFYHGIIGNEWYDRNLKKITSSVSDPTETSVGSNDSEGAVSPRRLFSSTITDQLKLASGGNSKIISISLKDRAAVLPGGHLADQAYWYNTKTGDFISSSYYMKSLPDWVVQFNNKKLSSALANKTWNLSRPVSDYKINGEDESKYEEDVFSEGKTSFPHSLKNVKEDQKLKLMMTTPFGNTLVAEFAKTAIEKENLGKNSTTDFLAISFSTTDYIGHAYGSNSFEIQDTYIKLDSTIADLLKTLDKKIGKGNYLYISYCRSCCNGYSKHGKRT